MRFEVHRSLPQFSHLFFFFHVVVGSGTDADGETTDEGSDMELEEMDEGERFPFATEENFFDDDDNEEAEVEYPGNLFRSTLKFKRKNLSL